jgi:hypothetical protein
MLTQEALVKLGGGMGRVGEHFHETSSSNDLSQGGWRIMHNRNGEVGKVDSLESHTCHKL